MRSESCHLELEWPFLLMLFVCVSFVSLKQIMDEGWVCIYLSISTTTTTTTTLTLTLIGTPQPPSWGPPDTAPHQNAGNCLLGSHQTVQVSSQTSWWVTLQGQATRIIRFYRISKNVSWSKCIKERKKERKRERERERERETYQCQLSLVIHIHAF